MMIHSEHIAVHTRGHADMLDLTESVRQVVAGSGVARGLAVVFCPSSTSALTTIEFEDGALDDLRRALDEIAPADRDYRHNLRWGDGNGHAHLRAALLGPSLAIPILDADLTLGAWQQIVYIDFDVRPRQRQLLVQVIGEET